MATVRIKLMIDTHKQKVLFAEAGKDFVDFLFNLLALPIGTVTNLITKESMVGSLGNLYDSVETINDSYLLRPQAARDALLRPKLGSRVALLPDTASAGSASRKFYSCKLHAQYLTDEPNIICPSCSVIMSRQMTLVTSSGDNKNNCYGGDGFVNGSFTYMVMDDLVVKPLSPSIATFKGFKIKDIDQIEERVVYLDLAQGVKLLKASLETKTVLTSVFLGVGSIKRRKKEPIFIY